MSNIKKNADEPPLYISIELPDNRKRVTVKYVTDDDSNVENETFILITNTSTFSGFLSTIIERFKLNQSIKPKLRVKTTDGRRITDLQMVYNYQVLYVAVSSLTTSMEYNEELLEKLKDGKVPVEKENTPPDQLDLFTNAQDNTNEFQIDIKKLKGIYKHLVVVGECYPYRCKVLISKMDRTEYVILYLEEPTSTVYGSGAFTQYRLEGENKHLIKQISDNVNARSRESEFLDIVDLTDTVYREYSKFSRILPTLELNEKSRLIFPSQIIFQTTTTVNQYVNENYQKIQYISKHLMVPTSVAKDLLFKSKWQIPNALYTHKHKYHPVPCHKNNDIFLFKFKGLSIKEPGQTEVCSICYCDYDIKLEMIELICGHRFCSDCLKQYASTSIGDGNGNSSGICCPSIGCENKLLDEVTIESLLNEKPFTKSLNNFYNDLVFTSGARWCTSPNCERLIPPLSKTKNFAPFVICECRKYHCLYCNKSDFHWPLPCAGNETSEDELMSISWIARFTTPCPFCKNPVEKSTGCNHMTCMACKNEFCYNCGAKYNGHTCSSMTPQRKIDNFIGKYLNNSPAAAAYLKMNHKLFYDDFVSLLYNNLILALFANDYGKVKGTIETLIQAITSICSRNSKHNVPDSITIKLAQHNIIALISDCANRNQRVFSPSTYVQIVIDKSRSLVANICLNGSQKVIGKEFVFTQFFQFKQEICKNLKKNANVDADPTKIKIYTQQGCEIKSSQEILYGEDIYVCLDKSEKFLEPLEYEEPPSKEIEEQIKLTFGEKVVAFNVLDTKKKRNSKVESLKKKQQQKQEIINQLQVVQNTVVSPDIDQDVTATLATSDHESDENSTDDEIDLLASLTPEEREKKEKEIRELIVEFEKDESKQVDMYNRVLDVYKDEPALNFEQVYQICHNCSTLDECFIAMSDYFDEKNHFKNYSTSEKEIIVKDKIQNLFPDLSTTIIYRAINENNCDLELSTSWLLSKYGTLINQFANMTLHSQKPKSNNNNNNSNQKDKDLPKRNIEVSYGSEYLDDENYEDEYEYDDYDEIVDNIKLHPSAHTHWW
ncbi:hypothetical protein DLAC_11131 [Tieghemostelium lacteum]|uniref:RBR-type E3 ubiquitin transferase n=1 Tax=Tieghemostelium lacteum TaxID=361077 RepID=A0A151Z3D1_TIELA|nr:hypothetical protein DLAC_11131 [Tieghemostelium lacteum]|eukprot:KYQ88427.1 hypothetical protein DLAC_11131 [Tieghemostelium lacteum]